MRVLLTNDDGIFAPGLAALRRRMSQDGWEVHVVAPDSERSAVGHAITLRSPLGVVPVHEDGALVGHAVSGTPADCVKLALRCLLPEQPDLVVAGINPGLNTGVAAFYSGTVGAAREAALSGVPAIAVSLAGPAHFDFSYAAAFTSRLAARVVKEGLPEGTYLSVSIPGLPRERIKGVVIASQTRSRYREEFERENRPGVGEYYWLAGDLEVLDDLEDSDHNAISRDMIAVTPLHCDMTDYKALDLLRGWGLTP